MDILQTKLSFSRNDNILNINPKSTQLLMEKPHKSILHFTFWFNTELFFFVRIFETYFDIFILQIEPFVFSPLAPMFLRMQVDLSR